MVKARYAELVAPEAPAPTAMAKIDSRHLFAREDDEDICGVYTQSGKTGTVFPFLCGKDTRCETTSGFFGCSESVYTACYAATDKPPATRDEQGAYCTGSVYSHCWTGIKEVDGEDITAYRCDSTANDDPISVMMTIESEVTQTKTNDEGSPTVVVTTLPPVTATVSVTRSGAGAEQTGSENSDGGSETPIGAIVGGVVGGVALIALIAFGLWFIRFQKRKAAADNAKYNAQSPYGYPSTMQQAMYGEPYTGNQGNQAPIYHQLPADESDRPKPKTPPPVELPNNSV
ncbi:hypothetical protein BHE90_002194 [Fusarium euwallaceae]|uniref:Mid2 domain-containing protein n=1 Tax=Fusarium euwallaceae TaxID=1147111 RepID=A0A430M5D2_9HYPO|nr:hypothetical protein BHE90_002194 [Fusarium euwallaceae]